MPPPPLPPPRLPGAWTTPATLLTALGNLNTGLCPIGTTLNQANMFNTNIRLSPNNQVTGPNLPATFTILLNNSPASTSLQVFDLSVTGVPNGVTAHFSQPSITLGPWGSNANFSNSVTLTLTPGAAFTAPLSFNVAATPRGGPEFAVA